MTEPIYRTADKPWSLADHRGNHRVIVRAEAASKYVKADIFWRRRDLHPERCAILVRRMTDDLPVNAKAISVTRTRGEIVFEAPTAGEYALYYMPNFRQGDNWWHPVTEYAKEAFPGCDAEWEQGIPTQLPTAAVVAIESRTEFDSFYPMELPATAEETDMLLASAGDAPFVVFPEERRYPVRMWYELPYRWVQKGLQEVLCDTAQPDEYYVFQLAVYAKEDIAEIDLAYRDFSGNIGLTAQDITCYNREGVDWLGKPFINKLHCDKGKIQALWFGLQLPKDKTGALDFSVIITANGHSASTRIHLDVAGEPIADHGDGELWRLSRLRWLNSRIGLSDQPAKPYTPVRCEGDTLSCLGRSVTFGDNGFPAAITSFFDRSIQVSDKPLAVLRDPVEFAVCTDAGKQQFAAFSRNITCETAGAYGMETGGENDALSIKNESRFEYDGHIETFVTLTAKQDVTLSDVSLNLALTPECSAYMMGMGREGGNAPAEWEYRWDENRANNFVWIGGVNGGLHLKLKHTDEVWELYNYKKTGLPDSWYNGGKGGCRIAFDKDGANLCAYSGERSLKAGECLIFRYSLQITPLKSLNSDAHWHDRYDHPGDKGIDLQSAKAGGATVVNLHQGQKENPYINYPFCRDEILKPEIEKAHEMGIKYKLYYTVRELTTHAQEFFAVRSFGNEILLSGPGFKVAEHFKEGFFEQKSADSTGGPWLCEHLPEGYTPAWQTLFADGDYDCAVATVGLSRWHNYYLEGLSWLMRKTGADGIYLDGVGYDRQIMKRVRKVLDQSKEGCLIDFHSGNNFHPDYGLCNVLSQYMELLPSVDSLWIGEGFDYENTAPDYWLVEISGIPFGLMGDMLHRGGNKWRGMVFGMTPRCNWPEGGSPLPVWQLWDSFGMTGCMVRGWWDERCPVTLSESNCKATAYVGEDRMLISVASWAGQTVQVQTFVRIPESWNGAYRCVLPAIEGFQQEQEFAPGDSLTIEPNRGKIIVITKMGE